MVCVQYGIVSVPYFLDIMKPYELSVICDSLHLRHKEQWEQSRLISYVVAQVNSKKHLKPTDIVKFPWESSKMDNEKVTKSSITIEDVERMKAKALEKEKVLKEKGII